MLFHSVRRERANERKSTQPSNIRLAFSISRIVEVHPRWDVVSVPVSSARIWLRIDDTAILFQQKKAVSDEQGLYRLEMLGLERKGRSWSRRAVTNRSEKRLAKDSKSFDHHWYLDLETRITNYEHLTRSPLSLPTALL